MIIIYTASGRGADYISETSPTAPAPHAQPKDRTVRESSLISRLQEDGPRFTFEDHRRRAAPGYTCDDDDHSSTNIACRSDPGSTTISFQASPQTPFGESPGDAASEKSPAPVSHPTIDY